LRDVRARVWHFLSDIEREYANKTILFISHDDPLWMLETVASGWNERESIFQKNKRGDDFVATAEFRPLSFLVGPRNETGEYDLHRPYIDSVTFACDKCSGVMARVPELADVWFDSGAMPYAQAHFPFEKGQKLTVSGGRATVAGIEYPADYIAEATDQTRGWFYTLLAVSSVLGLPAAYRAAVCLGLINDKHGKKMSKSKGNIVNPWDMAKTYGMDGVRWYFYTVNPPGEPKNFDERDVVAATRRVHLLIYNSFVFYKTYANKQWKSSHASASSHVLDVWMMAQLNQTVFAATQALDSYDVREAVLCIERLVDDLSRWYIRRIRRRLQKSESSKDHLAASAVLGETLSALARLMAPFSPFFAEALTQELHACSGSLKNYRSVHLQQFPKASKPKKTDTVLFSAMEEVRRVASVSLSARASAAIKVRQPLASVSIKNTKSLIRGNSKLLAILADEVNVKNVLFDAKLSEDIVLDVVITPELKSEGMLREIVRGFQELRQEAHLVPTDTPTVATSATFLSREQIDFIAREVNASVLKNTISKNPLAVSELDIDGATVRIAIEKK
jgi:isoleucyl-tRNA synthetase